MRLVESKMNELIPVEEVNYDNNIIIVGIKNGAPVIFSSTDYEKINTLVALDLSDGSLQGNVWDTFGSIQDILEGTSEAHVFKSEDWKDALRWLIENVKK